MGMADSNETKTIDIRVLAKARPPSATKPIHHREVTESSGSGGRRRYGLIAVAAVMALLWWLL
jgi:hypothetical protein